MCIAVLEWKESGILCPVLQQTVLLRNSCSYEYPITAAGIGKAYLDVMAHLQPFTLVSFSRSRPLNNIFSLLGFCPCWWIETCNVQFLTLQVLFSVLLLFKPLQVWRPVWKPMRKCVFLLLLVVCILFLISLFSFFGSNVIFSSTPKPVNTFQWLWEFQRSLARLSERVLKDSSCGLLWPAAPPQFSSPVL